MLEKKILIAGLPDAGKSTYIASFKWCDESRRRFLSDSCR